MMIYADRSAIVKRFAAIGSHGGYAEPAAQVNETRLGICPPAAESKTRRLLHSLSAVSQDINDDRSAHLSLMEAVDTDVADRVKQSSANTDIAKTFPRPTSRTKITYPPDAQQDRSQRCQISQLVRAMAALRLENRKTEEMVEKGYEVLDPNTTARECQHTVALEDEYVFVDKSVRASRRETSYGGNCYEKVAWLFARQ
jgi:hypothetical protein